jgi:hypothetical protein
MKRARKCLTEQRIREFTRGLIISVDMKTVEVLAFRLLGWTAKDSDLVSEVSRNENMAETKTYRSHLKGDSFRPGAKYVGQNFLANCPRIGPESRLRSFKSPVRICRF